MWNCEGRIMTIRYKGILFIIISLTLILPIPSVMAASNQNLYWGFSEGSRFLCKLDSSFASITETENETFRTNIEFYVE